MILQVMLRRLQDSAGVDYAANMSELRSWLKGTDPDFVIEQIERVDDLDLFRHLQAAGLQTMFSNAMKDRADELERQGGG